MNKILAIIGVLILIGAGIYIFKDKETYDQGTATSTSTSGYGVDLDGASDAATSTTPSSPPAYPANSSTSPSASTGSLKTFTVVGSSFAFSPAALSVNKGDRVKIIFKNSGGLHDFKIDEFKVATHQIQGGTSETVEFVADKAGTFEYYCSVGTHRQMGMRGTLTVK